MRCVWQVENNLFCQRVLARHWPEVKRFGDIREFKPGEKEAVDVVCGGFPCKQTSAAAAVHGSRVGLAGKDSGLWFEMLRVVRLLRPRWVVVENVAGARKYSEEIQGGLAAAGYRLPREPLGLSAAALGAPHLRKRLFWVANRHESGLSLARFTGPSQVGGDTRRAADGNLWLSSLSRTLRVDDGVSGRVDRRERIVALGNAVVPAMSEYIGRLITEVEFGTARSDSG